MKRRHRVVLNLFSFALLLIALYLNFVKKETNDGFVPTVSQTPVSPVTSSLKIHSLQASYKPSDGTLVLK